MLNFSPEKLLVIGMLALLVLGPNRLPTAARSVGRVVGQLRRMSGSLQSEMRDVLAEPRQALQHAVAEFGLDDVKLPLHDTFAPAPAAPPAQTSASWRQPPAAASAPQAAPARGIEPPAPDDPSLN